MFSDSKQAATPTAPSAPNPDQLEDLLVLSQAPLSLDEALAQEAEDAAADAEPQPMTVMRLAVQYAQIVAHFVGVGLIIAAVRHLEANPNLYLGLGAAGVLTFAVAAATMDTAARRGGPRAFASFAAASALLALGLGLLVGGVLHFTAFPHTGAVLVPAGMVLSFAGHALRSGRELLGRGMLSPAVTMIGIVVWVGIGLGFAAKELDPTPLAAKAAHGATAGEHGEDAAHGDPAAAKGDHGATPASAEHSADAGHGATADAGHGAAAEKPADASHGADAAHDTTDTASHDTAADAAHSEPAAKAEADHGAAADSHDAAAASHDDAGH